MPKTLYDTGGNPYWMTDYGRQEGYAPFDYSAVPTITPTTTQTPTATTIQTPTIGSAYGIASETPQEQIARLSVETNLRATQTPTAPAETQQQTRDRITQQFQEEIDRLNQVYAGKKIQATRAGEGRLGEIGAMQARSGLFGSGMGGAMTEGVRTANQQVQDAIQAQQNYEISQINARKENIITGARASATAEYDAKRQAREQGAVSLLAFYRGEAGRKKGYVSENVNNILANNITPDEAMFKSLASQLGVSIDEIKATYNIQKSTMDVANAKAQAIQQKQQAELAKTQAETAKLLAPKAELTSTELDLDMIKKGYSYVKTPTERDLLKGRGYEISEVGGRTYAKAGAKVKLPVGRGVRGVPSFDTTGYKEGDIKEVNGKYQILTPAGDWRKATTVEVKAETPLTQFKQIEKNLLSVVGADGFLNPDDYLMAKQDWVQVGGSSIDFDNKFKNRRNPNNPYYKLEKAPTQGQTQTEIPSWVKE